MPQDNHYLPVFYLKRWASADGRVCRFSRPYGSEVKVKRVVPTGTAFEPGLYEARGLPPGRAQTLEKAFLAQLDSGASEALNCLENHLPDACWDDRRRTGWSRFMLAQLLRCPEDITHLKSSVSQEWEKEVPAMEEAYADCRSPYAPPTIQAYLDERDPSGDEFALDIVRMLMEHQGIIDIFNRMYWLALEIPHAEAALLTSDRPIWMTATLTEPDAFIIMPIGPRKLFTATVALETQQRLKMRPIAELGRAVSKLAVEHAVKFVYGVNDDAMALVQEYMATKRHSSLAERLAISRGHRLSPCA